VKVNKFMTLVDMLSIVRNKTLKTSRDTVEDTEMESCLSKAESPFAEGCAAHGHSKYKEYRP
jgi:hypothetical protein